MKWLNKLMNAGYQVECMKNKADSRFRVWVFESGNGVAVFQECDHLAEELFQLACKRLDVK